MNPIGMLVKMISDAFSALLSTIYLSALYFMYNSEFGEIKYIFCGLFSVMFLMSLIDLFYEIKYAYKQHYGSE